MKTVANSITTEFLTRFWESSVLIASSGRSVSWSVVQKTASEKIRGKRGAGRDQAFFSFLLLAVSCAALQLNALTERRVEEAASFDDLNDF